MTQFFRVFDFHSQSGEFDRVLKKIRVNQGYIFCIYHMIFEGLAIQTLAC